MAVHGAPLRAGVVGTGHMGQYHVLVYAELPDVELVGVADTDADRAAAVARQYETQPFTDHRELIGKVDVASVAGSSSVRRVGAAGSSTMSAPALHTNGARRKMLASTPAPYWSIVPSPFVSRVRARAALKNSSHVQSLEG